MGEWKGECLAHTLLSLNLEAELGAFFCFGYPCVNKQKPTLSLEDREIGVIIEKTVSV